MAKRNNLTPAEWEIMEVVWALGTEATVREVLERAYPKGEKAYTTVQTVMNTLAKKKLLRRKKTGMVNFYRPTCSKDDMARAEMTTMVSRIFGGSIPALANSLLSLDDFSLDQIEEIKKLLDEKARELREGDP
ncbi:MAG: BlaI/MecI/CopY family transcriptional regulator [Candidatus Krumholzibacteria bacterium]|nr:BlaI/MecI/CopY family transcriptional regulator [Candidatus Krumholzibacteria bacterium]